MLAACFDSARAYGLIAQKPRAAIDATCFDTRHCSRYFQDRRGPRKGRLSPGYCKLTVVCDLGTHLIAGMAASFGPSNDQLQFPVAVRQSASVIAWTCLYADSGYDGEHHHALCRDELNIPDTVININPRNNGRKWPKTRYRREMIKRLREGDYGQRWQVESLFSRHKRRLGQALRARRERTQLTECALRALTHNFMILRPSKARLFNRAPTGQSYRKRSSRSSSGHTRNNRSIAPDM